MKPEFVRQWLSTITKEESSRTLISGATVAFAIKAIGAALNFATQVFLARMLGAKEYGYFAYAVSWMIVLSVPAQLGLRDSLIRFIPEYEVTNRPGHIRGILRFALKAVFIAVVCIAAFFAFILFVRPNFWEKEQITVLWIMLAALPLFTLNRIRDAGLRAFRRVALAFAPEHIIRPIALCGLCTIVYLNFNELSAWQAWLCNTVAFVVAFILGSFWLWRSLPEVVRSSAPQQSSRQWMIVSLPMFMMTGMNVLMNQSGVVLLGFFVPSSDVGVYAVCARIVILVNFALSSVNAIAGPLIAKLFHGGKKQEMQQMLTLAARGIFAITFLAALFFGFFGKYVLHTFGPAFVKGYGPLLILMVGQIVNALAGSVGLIMNMTGHQNNAAKILGFSVLVNLSANLVLIPTHGLYGAAIATALSLGTWNVLMLRYVWKHLKLNPTIVG